MQWHLNDLSLDGQFPDAHAFRAALEPLLKLRERDPSVRNRFYCSRSLSYRMVTATSTFQQAVLAMGDRLYKQLVLSWLTRAGPFWEDDRLINEGDYFEYCGEDVTHQGLAEAARRGLTGVEASTFSFTGGRHDFRAPSVGVLGLVGDDIKDFDVANLWDVSELERAAQAARPEPRRWTDAIDEARRRFGQRLIIADDIEEPLRAEPFNRYVVQRTFELLAVLDAIVAESNEQGGLSPRGVELINQYFVGEKAWFTAESHSNMHQFAQELKFRDPADKSNTLVCGWHGKIKTPQYRIHFEWPRPPGQREIKVVYIGPKITKA